MHKRVYDLNFGGDIAAARAAADADRSNLLLDPLQAPKLRRDARKPRAVWGDVAVLAQGLAGDGGRPGSAFAPGGSFLERVAPGQLASRLPLTTRSLLLLLLLLPTALFIGAGLALGSSYALMAGVWNFGCVAILSLALAPAWRSALLEYCLGSPSVAY